MHSPLFFIRTFFLLFKSTRLKIGEERQKNDIENRSFLLEQHTITSGGDQYSQKIIINNFVGPRNID